MRFSLILATVTRTTELERFLRSLEAQSRQDFELVVVDQNEDDRLTPILDRFSSIFPVRHLRSERGLSLARNVGLEKICGEIIAFPDDDCWYPENLLDSVSQFFDTNLEWGGLTGRCTDELGRISMGRFDKRPGEVTYYNLWRRLTSFTIFLKSDAVAKCGRFDETLGVGSGTPWGAAEEMDFVLRGLERGIRVYYDPNLIVYHPLTVERYDEKASERHSSYSRGIGRVLALHSYPLWYVGWYLIRPLGGAIIFLTWNPKRARYHYQGFWGRYVGWLSGKR
jgi:glycosyltransferase involved in cell wall biosynthesis